jgi:aminopeptidase N
MRTIKISLLLLALTSALFCQGNQKRNESLDIARYIFNITLNDSSDVIMGNATIKLKVIDPVDSLRFDLRNSLPDGRGMKISEVMVDSVSTRWVHRNDKVVVASPVALVDGTELSVTIVYKGIPADGLLISKTKFGNRSFFADHWPDRASNYLPCIDHLSDKAAVEFIITAPVHYKVVSNGILVEESNLPDSRKLTHWREDVPLPVKVMTFGAAEFSTQFAGMAAGVPVYTYVYPENRDEGFHDYSLALRPMEFYSSLIGPYPFPKLANVQSKTVFGGLENAGAIFYSENSVTGTGRSEGLIAHEIAHQWFGNSVTEADWHHVWLSEGFATYLTTLYWEDKTGIERLRSDMKSARERVLRSGGEYPKPVIDTTITDLMRLLSANSYQKGAWVLHMLRNEIGEEQFVSGLQLYYSRYRNSNALTSDFRMVMEEVSGRDLEKFFHQWLYIGGQPELKIDWTYNSRSKQVEITIIQTQEYLFNFPLEIEIQGENENPIQIKLDINKKVTKTEVSSSFKPLQILTDPRVMLLFQQNSTRF